MCNAKSLWCQGHGGIDSPQRHRGHEGNARTDGSKEMAGNRRASRAQQNRSAALQPKIVQAAPQLLAPSGAKVTEGLIHHRGTEDTKGMQELMVVRKWPAIEGHHARSKTDQRRSNQKLSKQHLN